LGGNLIAVILISLQHCLFTFWDKVNNEEQPQLYWKTKLQ
jgi:hypothetical protein